MDIDIVQRQIIPKKRLCSKKHLLIGICWVLDVELFCALIHQREDVPD
jgi:hypothetical protein